MSADVSASARTDTPLDAHVQVRKCGPADVETLVALRVAFLLESGMGEAADVEDTKTALRAFLAAHLDADLHAWVAERDGEAVAMAAVSVLARLPKAGGDPEANAVGYVQSVYTRPDHRRQGMAAAMLREALGWMTRKGLYKGMLYAMEDGRRLYEGLGFEPNEKFLEIRL